MFDGVSLIEVFPLLLAGISSISATIIKTTDHPKENYKDEVTRIQNDRWNDVCNALGPVVVDVYAHVESDDNSHAPEDLEDDDKVALFLRRALENRTDLEQVEDELERLDEPKQVYRECRESRKKAIWLFALGILLSLVAFVLLMFATQVLTIVVLELLVAGIALGAILSGLWYSKIYFDRQTKLDEMSEDIDFM